MYTHIFEKYLPGYEQASDKEQDALWDNASPQTIYELNTAIQRERGQGADQISMCELGREDEQMGDYTDLLSFDIVHWVSQQKHIYNTDYPLDLIRDAQNLKVIHTTPENYVSLYYGDWFRLFYRDEFTYGNLYSAVNYILDEVEERVEQWLEANYPYSIKMDVQAGEQPLSNPVTLTPDHQGNRDKAVAIKVALRPYYQQYRKELNGRLNHEPVATYIIERLDEDGFPTVDFICHNDTTLRLVRPLRFVTDITRYQKSVELLDPLIDEYHTKVRIFLAEQNW